MPRRYDRILISRMKFIGDVILTTPIIRSLRDACPGAYICYMGEKNAVSLLEHNPYLDEIIPFDFSRPTWIEQPRVAWRLRQAKFDLAIDLFNNPRSAFLMYASGARTRIGAARRGRGSLYTIQVPDDGLQRTAIEFHGRFLHAAGMELTSTDTEIFLTEDELREARIYLQWFDHDASPLDMTKPLIGIHPGASWPAKIWPADRFAELADQLRARFGAQVLLTTGPRDTEVVKTILDGSRSPVQALPILPLRQLAGIMAHCSVFISNDAGPMHMSAAVGTPTIGLFGPGEENIWFPYASQKGHRALRKDVPCHPCHLDFCNREGEGFMECMKLLQVQEVVHAVEQVLNHAHRTR